MAINPKTPGVHHINFRCLNLDETKKFYRDVIGFPIVLENDELFAFPAGNVIVVFKKADNKASFDPFTVGTDHVAFTCESEEELNRIAKGLSAANVENTGVKMDPLLQKKYVAFKDPDRIQLEFYMQ